MSFVGSLRMIILLEEQGRYLGTSQIDRPSGRGRKAAWNAPDDDNLHVSPGLKVPWAAEPIFIDDMVGSMTCWQRGSNGRAWPHN